jgi:hypothetical protein
MLTEGERDEYEAIEKKVQAFKLEWQQKRIEGKQFKKKANEEMKRRLRDNLDRFSLNGVEITDERKYKVGNCP